MGKPSPPSQGGWRANRSREDSLVPRYSGVFAVSKNIDRYKSVVAAFLSKVSAKWSRYERFASSGLPAVKFVAPN
jgi:hypothetical protein